MSTYDRIADLPVRVDGYALVALRRDTSSGFERISTAIHMHGGGHEGQGEDPWIEPDDHAAMIAAPLLDLRGDWTVASLSDRLAAPDVFPNPRNPLGPSFRRWGFESAALDLALRQAGLSLADALSLRARPVRFVQSIRLGEPSTLEPLRRRLARNPGAHFKLDPVPDWDADLVADMAALAPGAVEVLDFKAHYHGTVVDVPADPALYRRCLDAFPDAWIEDPHTGPETEAVLAPHRDRVTWDAPLHSLGDVLALDPPPRMINIKPCRFGSLRKLMQVYDHCTANNIGMYGGGFFELGPGRGQIQYLASLFHPDGPNDVAPRGYHWPDPPDGLPAGPLDPVGADPIGFRWVDADPPPASPD